jgi:hypothetical protein
MDVAGQTAFALALPAVLGVLAATPLGPQLLVWL